MKSQIENLQRIANDDSRRIVGLMSGTSLDGLDIALCHVSGHGNATEIVLEHFTTVPYSEELVHDIRSIFSKQQVALDKVCLLNEKIGTLHGTMVKQQLDCWGIPTEQVDLIASHGQTIYHAPASHHKNDNYPNGTLQIGDGDHVARASGIITLSDFRQRQIAAGGEGAPLVMYGDSLLFTDPTEDRILLNIGGIANFTYLPSRTSGTPSICSDVGPGNTLMDAYVQKYFDGMSYDADARIAKTGSVHSVLLDELLSHSFFTSALPKTTGPELFNLSYLENCLNKISSASLSHVDIMATLNAFTVSAIVQSLRDFTQKEKKQAIYVSGGGARNPLLVQSIQEQLPTIPIKSSAELGIDPDAKEAILFALLANECVAGVPGDVKTASEMPVTSMGKICLPV